MNKWSHADAKTSHGLTSLYWLIVMIAVVMISSLTACVPLQQPSLSQPISPPPRVLDSPLIDNRWRVETVTHQGEDVPAGWQGEIHMGIERDARGAAVFCRHEDRYPSGQ